MNAAGQQPVHMRNIAVEFGIYRNERGQYRVYNMTLQGGHPLTQEGTETQARFSCSRMPWRTESPWALGPTEGLLHSGIGGQETSRHLRRMPGKGTALFDRIPL